MAEQGKKGKMDRRHVRVAGGIFLTLLWVFVLLSPSTALRGASFPFIYLFGGLGYWLLVPILLLLSLCLIFKIPLKWLKVRYVFGAVFAFLTACLVLSYVGYKATPSNDPLASFNALITSALAEGDLKVVDSFLPYGGGIIGVSLLSLFASLNLLWVYVLIFSLLFLLAVCLFILPEFVILLKTKSVAHKAKKERSALPPIEPYKEELGERQEEVEESPKPVERLELKEEETEENPFPFFQSAGKQKLDPMASSLTPAQDPFLEANALGEETAPKPIPTPTFSPSTPKISGLREAHFSLSGSTYQTKNPYLALDKEEEEEEKAVEEEEEAPAYEAPFEQPVKPLQAEIKRKEENILPDLEPHLFDAPIKEEEEEEEESEPPIEAKPLEEAVFTPPPLKKKQPEEKVEEEPASILPQALSSYPDEIARPRKYTLPPLSLLKDYPPPENLEEIEQECLTRTEIMNRTFASFKIGARVVSHTIGPAVTRYEIEFDENTTSNSVSRYISDFERRLGGPDVRFVPIVPGSVFSAFEVANTKTSIVSLREVLEALPKIDEPNLYIPFGKDIGGRCRGANMAKFPHMIVAGTTGSGKSIFTHCLVMSLIMRNDPDYVKLVLVDPKEVEMTKYRDIPHLLCPIITEAKRAKVAFKRLCEEMTDRYRLFSEAGVREIDEFNRDFAIPNHKKIMPYIVVLVDEYSDLSQQEKDIQYYVLRIGQKARSAGIFMCVATQRPEVKVITGTIKANMPVRVALSVANAIDSATILDEAGAEELNGNGDMLALVPEIQKKGPIRLQGAYVSGMEITRVAEYIKKERAVVYDNRFLNLDEEDEAFETPAASPSNMPAPTYEAMRKASGEEKYLMIKEAVMAREYTSMSQIMRDYSVGFNRAGKIFARLQAEGIVESSDNPTSSKGSRVLVHNLDEMEDAGVPDMPPDLE